MIKNCYVLRTIKIQAYCTITNADITQLVLEIEYNRRPDFFKAKPSFLFYIHSFSISKTFQVACRCQGILWSATARLLG